MCRQTFPAQFIVLFSCPKDTGDGLTTSFCPLLMVFPGVRKLGCAGNLPIGGGHDPVLPWVFVYYSFLKQSFKFWEEVASSVKKSGFIFLVFGFLFRFFCLCLHYEELLFRIVCVSIVRLSNRNVCLFKR